MRKWLSGNRRNIGEWGTRGWKRRTWRSRLGCLPGDVSVSNSHLDHCQFHGFGAAWGAQRVSYEVTSGHVCNWKALCAGNHRQRRRRRRCPLPPRFPLSPQTAGWRCSRRSSSRPAPQIPSAPKCVSPGTRGVDVSDMTCRWAA